MHQLERTTDIVRLPLLQSRGTSSANSFSLSKSSPHTTLNRSSVCACGGGCPRCARDSERAVIQPHLQVSEPGDPHEHEADLAAERVMRMPNPVSRGGPFTANWLARKKTSPPASNSASGGSTNAPRDVSEALSSPAHGLDSATRGLMEQRFGQDFSDVRIHTDEVAARSADALAAEAYTVGSHVVFGAGRYDPASSDGQFLLAHELAHVVQQGSDVRRMTQGHRTPPSEKLREVPKNELGRVQAAIAKVRKVAKDPDAFKACHKSFAEGCPGGNASSLEQAFDKTVLWRIKSGERSGAGASTICQTENVGYSDLGYGGGVDSLAFDLLHELGHICGIDCPEQPHHLADKLALYCMGPQESNIDNQIAVGLGLSTEDKALVFSYGWLLKESRSGRVGLRLNTDINLLGGLQAIKEAAGELAPAGEIAGLGLDLRLRPFSGERFGGLSFHAGLGSQVGRFVVRPPTADDPADIRFDAAAVVTLGGRIEYWVKDKDTVDDEGEPGRVKPRAFDFSYRAIQPVTTGARRAHEFVLSYIFHM
jgi:hypothetical protein